VTLYLAAPDGSPEQVLPSFKAARDVGARITIHVGVGPGGRSGLLEKLNAEHALGPDTTYIAAPSTTPNGSFIHDTGGTVSIAGF